MIAAELHELADTITAKTGRKVVVRRCVFGHGYPRCGCEWRLFDEAPGGGLGCIFYLGDTIPKANKALRGILFGIDMGRGPLR